MKNLILCLSMLLLVSGCKETLQGQLQVTEPVNVLIKEKLYQIPPGAFNANFVVEGSKSATLEIVVKKNSSAKVKFNLAAGTQVPGRNGPISLPELTPVVVRGAGKKQGSVYTSYTPECWNGIAKFMDRKSSFIRTITSEKPAFALIYHPETHKGSGTCKITRVRRFYLIVIC